MHDMAGDRRDVDDRTLPLRQRCREGARQDQRDKKVQVKHLMPSSDVAVEAAEPFFGRRFGRYAGIVNERVQWPVEQLARLGDEAIEIPRVAKIGSNMMRPVRVSLTLLRHCL